MASFVREKKPSNPCLAVKLVHKNRSHVRAYKRSKIEFVNLAVQCEMESFSSYMFYYGIQHSPSPPTCYVAASNALLLQGQFIAYGTQQFALALFHRSATYLKTQLALPLN